ncbi:hypothetical protein L1D14_18675 [Vibrio tubiashii]|uniref:hypothetical protein n=1 Tax=Vibrio tubiashii TaxID=29498 RepID=UPI001EFE9E1A|nr:hypothetical protein [Vibrio tubiashii]MCG9578242.1 hypothetical protein [Vibrio tubiashii]
MNEYGSPFKPWHLHGLCKRAVRAPNDCQYSFSHPFLIKRDRQVRLVNSLELTHNGPHPNHAISCEPLESPRKNHQYPNHTTPLGVAPHLSLADSAAERYIDNG